MNVICCYCMKTTLQHGIIENSLETSYQNNCTQLDFNLYLDFPCQKGISGQECTNQLCTHDYICLFFLGLFWLFSIINDLKFPRKLQKTQAAAYMPPHNMSNFRLLPLALPRYILPQTERGFIEI